MTPEMRITAQEFGAHLQRLLDERGLSQSDFAAKVWGRKTNEAGHSEALGRDRISAYVNGRSLPGPKFLAQMARALDMSLEEFAPSIAGAAAHRQKPAWSMHSPPGRPDLIQVTVDMLLPAELASELYAILMKVNAVKVDGKG